MAKVKDCPGFETFGADVKEARKAKNLARKDLAEKVNIDTRYLANIENEGTMRNFMLTNKMLFIKYLRPFERTETNIDCPFTVCSTKAASR